jgi:hypothetical protein
MAETVMIVAIVLVVEVEITDVDDEILPHIYIVVNNEVHISVCIDVDDI